MLSRNISQNNINLGCLMESPQFGEFDLQIPEKYLPYTNEYYARSLNINTYAIDYLHVIHGINDELMELYKLGFSSREIESRLPSIKSFKSIQMRSSVQRVTLLKHHRHGALSGCITVPVYQGRDLVGFYSESIRSYHCMIKSGYWACGGAPRIFNLDKVHEKTVFYIFDNPLRGISMMPVLSDSVLGVVSGFNLLSSEIDCIASKRPEKIVICYSNYLPKHIKTRLERQFKKYNIPIHFEAEIDEFIYGRA